MKNQYQRGWEQGHSFQRQIKVAGVSHCSLCEGGAGFLLHGTKTVRGNHKIQRAAELSQDETDVIQLRHKSWTWS